MSSSSPIVIRTLPLSAPGFAAFGTVVEAGVDAGRSVNQGRARRIRGLPDLSHDSAATRPVLDLYRIEPSTQPFDVTSFERHPLSCQVFIPMIAARFLVVVAPSDGAGQPDVAGAVAFLGSGAQAIRYRAGVWHAPMVALDAPATMAMLMWETGDARDCQEFSCPAEAAVRVVAGAP